MFRKALITGVTGSGGSYLADYIVEHQPAVEVHGLSRWHSTSANTNLAQSRGKEFVRRQRGLVGGDDHRQVVVP